MGTKDTLLHYWPVMVVAAGLVASGAVDNWRIGANAEEIEDVIESVEGNEEEINAIQRLLIRRQGEVEVQVQRIEIEQRSQGNDLDQILRILKELDAE